MFANYKGYLKRLASDDSQIMIAGEEAIFNGLVTPLKTDIAKILGSKALSRLARKTQVFISRKNPLRGHESGTLTKFSKPRL